MVVGTKLELQLAQYFYRLTSINKYCHNRPNSSTKYCGKIYLTDVVCNLMICMGIE